MKTSLFREVFCWTAGIGFLVAGQFCGQPASAKAPPSYATVIPLAESDRAHFTRCAAAAVFKGKMLPVFQCVELQDLVSCGVGETVVLSAVWRLGEHATLHVAGGSLPAPILVGNVSVTTPVDGTVQLGNGSRGICEVVLTEGHVLQAVYTETRAAQK